MQRTLAVVLIIICLGITNAQTFKVNLNPYPTGRGAISEAADTVRILAIMVQFEADRDAATFGNGKFGSIYTQNYGNTIIDPLPHDKPYFEAHLEFVKNYYRKVSGGRLTVEYTVLPDTFSVSKTMRNYSPPPNSDDFTPLADFAKEAWEIADNLYPGFNFSAYDLFTVFHAGVGRDISLPGSLGNERDLPSVYLGRNALREVYGNNFEGFPVGGGSFRISNSMIIPETESRELSGFGGMVLVQLSINGLLAASVASHLGLPDLFDTETGLSAIGRFGLMDGQSIFAYSGLFPPAPSAWEKIFLGWAEPVVVNNVNGNLAVAAELAAAAGDTVIIKVPISSTEYFLVENRMRDVNNDGANIRYVLGGDTLTKRFTQDRTGFYSWSVDSVPGVVIDVDEYDWAIPGLINDTSNFKGGIVIWHIAENVINNRLADNKINTDKQRRGVDVEEADGIQDIGERFQTIFGDIVIGEGTYQDLWFAGNDAELYTGVFSKDTRPSSRSNEGANSLITMSHFSEAANKMNFRISFGDSVIVPLVRGNIAVTGENIKISSGREGNNFYILSGNNLSAVSATGVINNIGIGFSSFKPAVLSTPSFDLIAGGIDSTISIAIYNNGLLTSRSINIGERITSAPVVYRTLSEMNFVAFGTEGGRIRIFNLTDIMNQNPVEENSFNTGSVGNIMQIARGNNYTAYLKGGTNNILGDDSGIIAEYNAEVPIQLGLTVNRAGENVIIVLTNANKFYIYVNRVQADLISYNSGAISGFGLADIDRRGENYIIFYQDNKVHAVNLSGASADNFPFVDPDGALFSGIPLAADIEGTLESEIIAINSRGTIYAINNNGRIINNFPISSGAVSASVPALYNYNRRSTLTLVDSTGRIYSWHLSGGEGIVYWGEALGNSSNNAFTMAASAERVIADYFPKDKFYNYPNPVYGGDTYIRYFVSEDSKINIKIFDLAGDFVAELNDDGRGGMDNEVRWNVNSIQSGIYLARIEAKGITGKSETGIIKIAVVK
jgi:hypothetical protein